MLNFYFIAFSIKNRCFFIYSAFLYDKNWKRNFDFYAKICESKFFFHLKYLYSKNRQISFSEFLLNRSYMSYKNLFIFSYFIKIFKSAYEISVFARIPNSAMKRARALQWPESVLVDNPYSGIMLKHIKTFCTNTEQHFRS